MLWLRGSADLRFACLRSVSVVGARAATGYGNHVAPKRRQRSPREASRSSRAVHRA